ncbi:MAG: hypothetical protein HYZ29_12795 [Myxococcales bacterium]|nr:hypothetical protein [Myxococcales bacterium]
MTVGSDDALAQAHPPPLEPARALGVQEIGLSVGAADYTESNVVLIETPGGDSPADPFRTRGGWLAAQGQVGFTEWLAAGLRGRLGWESRSPPSRPDPDETIVGGDPATLDPQLGDSRVGGSIGAMLRFLPGRTAIDVGATVSFGSFRPRYESDGVAYQNPCGDCDEGKAGFVALPVLPTLRLSRTGLGLVWAVGTGEGFIRGNEPTPFEALLGRRWSSVELWAGISRGLSARVDGRVTDHEWLSVDVSAKPWGDDVEGTRHYHWWMASLTLSRRWSSFAPL